MGSNTPKPAHRRHLTHGQKVTVAAAAEGVYAKRAKERHAKLSGRPSKEKPKARVPQVFKGQARDQVAKTVGVSGRAIDFATPSPTAAGVEEVRTYTHVDSRGHHHPRHWDPRGRTAARVEGVPPADDRRRANTAPTRLSLRASRVTRSRRPALGTGGRRRRAGYGTAAISNAGRPSPAPFFPGPRRRRRPLPDRRWSAPPRPPRPPATTTSSRPAPATTPSSPSRN